MHHVSSLAGTTARRPRRRNRAPGRKPGRPSVEPVGRPAIFLITEPAGPGVTLQPDLRTRFHGPRRPRFGESTRAHTNSSRQPGRPGTRHASAACNARSTGRAHGKHDKKPANSRFDGRGADSPCGGVCATGTAAATRMCGSGRGAAAVPGPRRSGHRTARDPGLASRSARHGTFLAVLRSSGSARCRFPCRDPSGDAEPHTQVRRPGGGMDVSGRAGRNERIWD